MMEFAFARVYVFDYSFAKIDVPEGISAILIVKNLHLYRPIAIQLYRMNDVLILKLNTQGRFGRLKTRKNIKLTLLIFQVYEK
jgi:hypothetical protein